VIIASIGLIVFRRRTRQNREIADQTQAC